MTSQVVRNLQMEITIVTCNLVRFSIFWSTSDNFWCAEFNESCNVSLCSTNSSIILCVKQHVQTTYKVCYKPLNIVKLVIVVRFQFSCLVYNIIQLFNGGGSNSSKYLAWGNGNDQVNYCTRPTAKCNSSLDHFHYRRPNILNYCNHIHQITVLLPNHTFQEEIEHNLVWFS
jgi:hypothetical protein